MTLYEIRKIFCKTGNKIALAILAGVFFLLVFYIINAVKWVDHTGTSHNGPEAVRLLREAQEAWEGDLTEEKIAEVIREEQRVNQKYQQDSENIRESNQNYAGKQGFAGIRELINLAYSDFQDYDYYRIGSLQPEESAQFYKNRIHSLRNWLGGEGEKSFTAKEKEFLLEKYEEIKTPFFYTWVQGWEELFTYFPTLILFLSILLGFLCAGIFSGEFQTRADAVYYSSMEGRRKASAAKIKAGVVVCTALYGAVTAMFTLLILAVLGSSGWNCPIQVIFGYWKSFYNITALQAYLLMAAGGYVGTLFLVLLTMLVAAWSSSSLLAATVPLLLTIAPDLLSSVSNPWVQKILGMLPAQLLQLPGALRSFTLYTIGGNVLGAAQILPLLYGAVSLALPFVIYRIFRRKEC